MLRRCEDMQSVEIENLINFKGVLFPLGEHFRQVIVTGPPGSGKTTLVAKLGGWSEEGYLDLAQRNWWRSRILTFRPREIHFGFPFHGYRESLAVFDPKWLESPSCIDFERVKIPPGEEGILQGNWRGKYAFDFQLISPERIYAIRRDRSKKGTHPVDLDLSLEQVQRQVTVYADLALYFHRQGLKVYVRDSFQGTPQRVVEPQSG